MKKQLIIKRCICSRLYEYEVFSDTNNPYGRKYKDIRALFDLVSCNGREYVADRIIMAELDAERNRRANN